MAYMGSNCVLVDSNGVDVVADIDLVVGAFTCRENKGRRPR